MNIPMIFTALVMVVIVLVLGDKFHGRHR